MYRIILAIFIILGACQNKTAQKNADKPEELNNNEETTLLTDSIRVHTLQIGGENTDNHNFNASYPETFFEFINTNEKNIAEEFKEEFENEASKLSADATYKIHFGQHFELIANNPALMGFLFENYRSLGNTYDDIFETRYYDLKEKRPIAVIDFFKDSKAFDSFAKQIQAQAEIKIKDIIQNDANLSADDKKQVWNTLSEDFLTGTAASPKNYKAIVFSKEKTQVIFDKYQIATGSFGKIEVEIATDKIASLLKNDYLNIFGIPQAKIEEQIKEETVQEEVRTPKEYTVDSSKQPCIALTFDDGPSIYTDKLLDILKENDAKATFFVLGKSAKIQKKTILRMKNEGHQIGNHSWDHKDLKRVSIAELEHQIYDTNEVIRDITSEAPHIIRPPYGSFNQNVKDVSKMPIILWNLDPLDWKDRNADIVAERMKKAKANGIVLAHDIHKTTIDAIPEFIKWAKQKGIHLVTIDELFGDSKLENGKTYSSRK